MKPILLTSILILGVSAHAPAQTPDWFAKPSYPR
jgi:hypothetical protein